jgi:hypothetical protein
VSNDARCWKARDEESVMRDGKEATKRERDSKFMWMDQSDEVFSRIKGKDVD